MRIFAIAASIGFGMMAAVSAANAAPQAMLLVAKGDSIPFRCKDDQCLAEATSICLQPERATPRAGTPYEIVDERRYGTGRPNGLHLIGVDAAGTEMALPLELMQMVSERDHMAVRFIVPRTVLQKRSLARVELRVTGNVVIAPVWGPGDAHPHLDDELEMVIGPVRATAEAVLRRQADQVTSARLLGDLLNDLPRDRVAGLEEREALYHRAVAARAAKSGAPVSAEALSHAQAALDACAFIRDEEMWYQAFNTRISRYRSCIGYRHDRLIKEVNKTYWEALKDAGS